MFNNLGLHTELLTPVSVLLLVVGAVLGYGSKTLISIVVKNPSEKVILITKLVGLVLVITGVILIFRR